jgi:hypothetical protein
LKAAHSSKSNASAARRSALPSVRKRGGNMTSGDVGGAADLARRVGQGVRDERMARDMSLDDLSRARNSEVGLGLRRAEVQVLLSPEGRIESSASEARAHNVILCPRA